MKRENLKSLLQLSVDGFSPKHVQKKCHQLGDTHKPHIRATKIKFGIQINKPLF